MWVARFKFRGVRRFCGRIPRRKRAVLVIPLKKILNDMKRKIFIPKEQEKEKPFFSFGTMSTAYWDFAIEMESKAINQFNSQLTSFYVFPTIVFYCASFEALLNEGLTKYFYTIGVMKRK